MTGRIQVGVEGNLWLGLGHEGAEVEVACFCADASRVLMVTRADTAQVYEVRGGRRVGTIRVTSRLAGSIVAPGGEALAPFIESADLSRDGAIALLGLNDGTAGLYRVTDGVRTAVLHEPDVAPASRWALIRAVAFSPDGARAAVGYQDRSVGVYSVADGALVRLLKHPRGARTHSTSGWHRETQVCTLRFSPDGARLFAGTADMEAAIWDVTTGALLADHWEHRPEVLDIRADGPQTRWATSAGEVWEADPGHAPRLMSTVETNWSRARFAPDAGWLVVQTQDRTVERRTCAGELLLTLPEHPWDHVPSPDGSAVAAVVRRILPTSVELRVWSLADGHLTDSIHDTRDVHAVAWAPCGRLLAIARPSQGSPGSTIVLRDVAERRTVASIEAPEERIAGLTFAPDGQWLASIAHGRAPAIRAWRALDGEPLASLAPDRETEPAWRDLRPLSGERLLIVNDVGFEVWRLPGTLVHRVDHGFTGDRAWTVSGERYLVSLGQGRIGSWDLATGAAGPVLARPAERPEVFPAPETTGGRTSTGRAALWRTEWGPVLHGSDGPRGWSVRPGLSADGRYAVVPCASEALLVALTSPPHVIAAMRFDGSLRAACVLGDRWAAVNEHGRVFEGRFAQG